MARKLALITGASAGIGKAFAELYARQGYDLALTARRKNRLEALAVHIQDNHDIDILTLPNDLSTPGTVEDLLGDIEDAGRNVDILINNAGYGLPGIYADTEWEEQAGFLQLMLNAPCELVHRVLPHMLSQKFGRIINVASLAGYLAGGKGHTLYGPVKAALIRFSESLHAECEADGVHVTALCPGFTYSEFHDVNGMRGVVSKLPDWMWQDADTVALGGYDANERNMPVFVTGSANKVIATVSKILPDPLMRALAKSQSRRFRSTKRQTK